MILYPYQNVHSFYYTFPDEKWACVYDMLVERHLLIKKHKHLEPMYKKLTFAFEWEDYVQEFEDLYNFFVAKARRVLGSLTLTDDNSKTIHVNVSDRNDDTVMHNHADTSIIGVYYFSQPYENEGGIDFLKGHIVHHRPKQGELLIFPGNLDHRPHSSGDNTYRIALSMAIKCKEQFK